MTSPSEKKLVLLRLETMPEDIEVSIGPWGTFSKEELINHVKKEDDVGEFIIQMQLEYLKNMKNLEILGKPDSKF